MKYKNKKTGAVVNVIGYAQEFAYKNNSLWEEIKETKKKTIAKKETEEEGKEE